MPGAKKMMVVRNWRCIVKVVVGKCCEDDKPAVEDE
jgi:hypothetical protein